MPNNPQPLTNNSGSCYLVTGAAGFIASKVCELLLAEGHTVVGVDNLNDYYDVRLKLYRLGRLAQQAGVPEAEVRRYGLDVKSGKVSVHLTSNQELKGDSLSQLLGRSYELGGSDPKISAFAHNKEPLTHNRFEFRVLDIENLEELDELFATRKFEAVFNLAARAGVRASLEHPELYRRTNVLGEENVLKCQVKYGVKKHVLASSSSVYAGCPMPFTEDAVLGQPQSPYAETKLQAEFLAKDYHLKHGLDVTVLRYFTVFGPAGRPDMAPFRFIKWIDEGTPITLYGDGTQARDFTYIDDIARGTVLAGRLFGGQLPGNGYELGVKSEAGSTTPNVEPLTLHPHVVAPRYDVINLGGGRNPISLHTIIEWIESALSVRRYELLGSGTPNPEPLTPNPAATAPAVKARLSAQPPSAADMAATWADIAKAGRLLGWIPQITPAAGFQRTVQWHIANRAWLKDIKP